MNLYQERLLQLFIGLGLILILLSGVFFNSYSRNSQDLIVLEKESNGVALLRKLQQLSISLQNIRGLEQINRAVEEGVKFSVRIDNLKQNVLEQIKVIQKDQQLKGREFNRQLTDLLISVKTTINENALNDKQSFENYSAVIDKVNDFFVILGDRSELLFDPDRTSYFLMILALEQQPQMIESLAKVRGIGSGYIEEKSFSAEKDYLLKHYLQTFQNWCEKIEVTLGLLLKHGQPTSILRLKQKSEALNHASNSYIDLIDEQLYQQKISITSDNFFNELTILINDMHNLFVDVSLVLDERLEKRKKEIQLQQSINLILFLSVSIGLIYGCGYFYFVLRKRLFDQKLKENVDQLNKQLFIAASLPGVCETGLNFICNYFSVLKGVLYLNDTRNEKLYLGASYAENRKNLRKILPLGDTVIGQSAKDARERIQNLDSDDNVVDEGVIKTHAKLLVTIPLVYEQQVVAVIQLALVKALDKQSQQLIDHFLRSIAYRIYDSGLKEERRKVSQLVDKNIITSSTNEKGFITSVSQAFIDISGFSREDLIGNQHSLVRHPDMPEEIFQDLWRTIKRGEVWQGELKNRTKQGGFYWVDVIISPEHDFYGNIIGYTAIRQDITDKKRIEALSLKDPMTAMYNRRFFDGKFDELRRFGKRERRLLIFGILDVDFFKQYNDFYGHHKGDIALIAIAGVIKLAFGRPTDFCFRLGGEEFGLLFMTESVQSAIQHVNGIRFQVENHLKIKHKFNKASDYVTVSVGLFGIDYDCELTQEECYQLADQQLYKAKNDGRNQVKFLSSSDLAGVVGKAG